MWIPQTVFWHCTEVTQVRTFKHTLGILLKREAYCSYKRRMHVYLHRNTKRVRRVSISAAALKWFRACALSSLIHCQATDANTRKADSVYVLFCAFKIFKLNERPADCEIRSVIRFLNARNVKPADIHRQICEVYGENAMNDGMVRKCVRKFNECSDNVHDEPRSYIRGWL